MTTDTDTPQGMTATFHSADHVDNVPNALLTAQYELDRFELGKLAAIYMGDGSGKGAFALIRAANYREGGTA